MPERTGRRGATPTGEGDRCQSQAKLDVLAPRVSHSLPPFSCAYERYSAVHVDRGGWNVIVQWRGLGSAVHWEPLLVETSALLPL